MKVKVGLYGVPEYEKNVDFLVLELKNIDLNLSSMINNLKK